MACPSRNTLAHGLYLFSLSSYASPHDRTSAWLSLLALYFLALLLQTSSGRSSIGGEDDPHDVQKDRPIPAQSSAYRRPQQNPKSEARGRKGGGGGDASDLLDMPALDLDLIVLLTPVLLSSMHSRSCVPHKFFESFSFPFFFSVLSHSEPTWRRGGCFTRGAKEEEEKKKWCWLYTTCMYIL